MCGRDGPPGPDSGSPSTRNQVTLVLTLEVYTALQALLCDRQLQQPTHKFPMRDLIE